MDYVMSCSSVELRTFQGPFHCERVRNITLSGLDLSMLISFLCKVGSIFDAEWQRYAALILCTEKTFTNYGNQLCKSRKTIFSIVDEPPS